MKFHGQTLRPEASKEEERFCFQGQDHCSYCLQLSLCKQGIGSSGVSSDFKRVFPFYLVINSPLLRRPRFAPLVVRCARTYAANITPIDFLGLTVFKMGPRESRDSTETTGNVHPAGKGKGKAKISRTSSNASVGDLTPEAVDAGIAAVRQISKIFHFMQSYHEEISDVESVYGLGIRQQAQINDLETTMTNLAFGKDQVMAKLRDENDAYQANARKFEREREELKREQASMDDTRKALQSKMERQKEMEINEAKREFEDKFKTRTKQIREELEKKIQALQTDKDELKDTVKKLEEKNIQAREDLIRQKEGLELDKRTSQSHIMRLESELNQINAASTVLPQTPGF